MRHQPNLCNNQVQVAMIDDKTLVLLGVGDTIFIIRRPLLPLLHNATAIAHLHLQRHGGIRRNRSAARAQGPACSAPLALLRENTDGGSHH